MRRTRSFSCEDRSVTPLNKGGRGDYTVTAMNNDEVSTLVTKRRHLPYDPDLVEKARALRKNMTPAEKKLWYQYLRNYPFRVLRQRPIDHYIVDFYCPRAKLVVEVDGSQNFSDEMTEYDRIRNEYLSSLGLRVLRFTNTDVLTHIERVVENIIENMGEIPLSPPFTKGEK